MRTKNYRGAPITCKRWSKIIIDLLSVSFIKKVILTLFMKTFYKKMSAQIHLMILFLFCNKNDLKKKKIKIDL